MEGVSEKSVKFKSGDMLPMPLTLANTLGLPEAPSTSSSVWPWGISLLTGGAGVQEGDFTGISAASPSDDPHRRQHARTFAALLPVLPGSWPGRIWAPRLISHSQEGVLVERWPGLISSWVGSEGAGEAQAKSTPAAGSGKASR